MKNNNPILKLLTPSWVVNVFGLAIGILTTAAVIVLVNYQGSSLKLQVFDVQSRSIVDQQQGIYANITLDQEKTSFIGALPLLITWACVGLGVYFFAMALARSFGRAAELREEMNYVNASPASVRKQAVLSLLIRLAAAFGWFLFIKLCTAVLVPYALSAAGAAAAGFSLAAVGYSVMATLVLYGIVVGNVIFLRAVLLRTRVFGG